MNREHRQAVVDRIRPWRVTDDRSRYDDPDWPAPWVVIDWPPMRQESDRWEAHDRHRSVGTFTVSCVGEDSTQALALHDAVTERLLNWRPDLAGWSTWPLHMDTAPRLLDPYRTAPDRVLVTVATFWTWQANRVPT